MNRGQNPETIRARFTASGFGTTTNTYATRDDLLLDANDTGRRMSRVRSVVQMGEASGAFSEQAMGVVRRWLVPHSST